jgi:hypothetical protein
LHHHHLLLLLLSPKVKQISITTVSKGRPKIIIVQNQEEKEKK